MNKIIQVKHDSGHAVFILYERNDEIFKYETATLIDDEWYGLYSTKKPVLNLTQFPFNSAQRQHQELRETHKLIQESYKLIVETYTQLQSEGQMLLNGGVIIVPNGSNEHEEQIIELDK